MTNTITVRRANVILQVPKDEKSDYLNKGYSVIDDKGKVLEEAISTDVNELRLQVQKLESVIKAKDEEISDLKKQLEPKQRKTTTK